MNKYYFAVDLGASSGRTMIALIDSGKIEMEEINRFPNHIIETGGHCYWDILELYRNILDGLKKVAARKDVELASIGLDYFDGSINRIGAYVVGSRAAQKCMTRALLEPLSTLRKYEAEGKYFERLALLEEAKSLPWNAVWDMFCLKNNVPVGESFIAEVEKYEAEVTSKR